MKRFFDWFNNLYPVWLVSLAVLAFFKPPVMLWFTSDWIFWSLAASMLGMGLTLSLEDLKAVGRMPGSVVPGCIAQYTLSVLLTLFSTILAFFFTPMRTKALAGQYVPVDAVKLALDACKLTLAPVVLGVLIRWKMPRTADHIGAAGPTIAVIAFVCVTGGIVAASAEAITKNFGVLALAALVLHVIGFGIGYLIPKVLRYPESVARTVSIEVGMQNGRMAASLARLHVASTPLAAAASVFSGVMQNIIGGIVAAIWKRRPPCA